MNHIKKILRGSTYYFIGSILATILAYLTKFVLVRNLSVEDYGLFFAVFTFVLFFSLFANLGMGKGLGRFIAEYGFKKKYKEIKSLIAGSFLIQMIASGIIIIIFWSISDYLAINYFKDIRASNLLRILVFYLPLITIYNKIRAIFQGTKNIKSFSLTESILNGAVFLIVMTGITFGLGIYAPAIAYISALILFILIFISSALKSIQYFKLKPKNIIAENRKLLLFSLPLMITTVGGLLITYFDTLMLTYFDTLDKVGIYNIIYPSALLIVIIGVSIGSTLLPILTELWSLKKKKEIRSVLKIINKYLLILCLPIVIILMQFSREIIRILFGKAYLAGVVAFNIILIGALFKVFSTINVYVLIAFKKPKKIMKIFLSGALLNVILNLFLIPLYSITGAAIASGLSFALMMILSVYYVNKKIKVKVPWKDWSLIGLNSILFILIPRLLILIIKGNGYILNIIGLIIGGIAYIYILNKIKIINIKEIKNIILQRNINK